ncbi:MAG: two-component system, cell cycle sensor histidine kinase and response regulator CckA [Verrucomicrobiota bacterium]
MLDQEDLKWIAMTSTELNSMLQQISRYADLAREHKGQYNYIELLGERVETAAKTAQTLFDRITSRILEGTAIKTAKPGASPLPAFTIVPPPSPQPQAKSKVAPAAKSISREKPKEAETRKSGSRPAAIPSDIEVLNPKGNRELILLVDDEIEVTEFASDTLCEEGYKVIVAHDGFEALRIYQQIGERIALVILDFFLPIMDGDAVFDELRALNPEVAVVLSSGFAEQSKLGNMLAQGLRGFIPKPYTREKLLEQIRSTIEASRETSR